METRGQAIVLYLNTIYRGPIIVVAREIEDTDLIPSRRSIQVTGLRGCLDDRMSTSILPKDPRKLAGELQSPWTNDRWGVRYVLERWGLFTNTL